MATLAAWERPRGAGDCLHKLSYRLQRTPHLTSIARDDECGQRSAAVLPPRSSARIPPAEIGSEAEYGSPMLYIANAPLLR